MSAPNVRARSSYRQDPSPSRHRQAHPIQVQEPHTGDKRIVRRKSDGTFGKTVDVGRSLSADKRTKAKKKVPKGQGDRRYEALVA